MFQIFLCRDIDGESWLLHDLRLQCFTPEWNTVAIVAGVAIVVYPVGIPLLFFSLLYRHRRTLQRRDTLNKLGS